MVRSERVKIVSATLASINQSFDKIKNTSTHSNRGIITGASIERLGRQISQAMRDGINNLAVLIDVEFETLLKLIFDDVGTHENRKINLVLTEANEIYEKGNEVLEEISLIASEMIK